MADTFTLITTTRDRLETRYNTAVAMEFDTDFVDYEVNGLFVSILFEKLDAIETIYDVATLERYEGSYWDPPDVDYKIDERDRELDEDKVYDHLVALIDRLTADRVKDEAWWAERDKRASVYEEFSDLYEER